MEERLVMGRRAALGEGNAGGRGEGTWRGAGEGSKPERKGQVLERWRGPTVERGRYEQGAGMEKLVE